MPKSAILQVLLLLLPLHIPLPDFILYDMNLKIPNLGSNAGINSKRGSQAVHNPIFRTSDNYLADKRFAKN